MERSESVDFDSVRGARKPRTFASRKPRTGSSQTFLPDFNHELLSPLSSSPSETRATTHNGSSSENLSRFSSEENDYDRGVMRKKIEREGGSTDCYRWEPSQNRGNWILDQDCERSACDTSVAVEYDGEGANDLKIRGGKIIVEDTCQQKRGRVSDALKQNLDVDDFENQKGGNSKGVNVKGQIKASSSVRCSEGALAPAKTSGSDWRNRLDVHLFETNADKPLVRAKRSRVEYEFPEADSELVHQTGDPLSQENRPTKVKLKVGGVTHTIHASHNGNSNATKHQVPVRSSSKPPQPSSDVRRQQRLIFKENMDEEQEQHPRIEKQGFTLSKSRTDGRNSREGSRSKSSEESAYSKRTDNDVADLASSQPVRKSSRVPKRRVLDGERNDDDNEDEALCRKNRASKRKTANSFCGEVYEEEAPQRRSARIPKRKVLEGEYDDEDEDYYTSRRSEKGKKKQGEEKVFGDVLCDNEESATSGNEDIGNSDLELDVKKKKSIKRELVSSLDNDKKEVPLTARQRALQSVKEAGPKAASKLIELHVGLPQTGQKKQKEKIPDLEEQLKKAEAAQRRRMQVEKAAKEIQAEAIRKILGHDSTRESRRDKLRKRHTKEKAVVSMGLGSNTVRWVIGPTGTTVSFSEDTGLPSIFNSTTCRYPPPRERCAGPSCTNTYKYRDSKSNLPLCSLQCYRAINDKIQPVTTC